MDKVNVELIRTAKKYALSLFEVARENDGVEEFSSLLNFVSEEIEASKELKSFLTNQIVKAEDKKEALKELFSKRLPEKMMNFLYILADNNRFAIIGDIAREYDKIEKTEKNIISVKIISAVEIKSSLKKKLQDKIERQTSKQADIEYEIKPEIIAGLIMEYNGKTIDNSVLTKIKNIRKQLI